MDAESGAEQIFVRQDIERLEERVRKLTEQNAALRDDKRALHIALEKVVATSRELEIRALAMDALLGLS